jgi:hypothetical protein
VPDALIEKSEGFGLPLRDGQAEEIVPIVSRINDRRLDLQQLEHVEALEFCRQGAARSGALEEKTRFGILRTLSRHGEVG